MEEKREGITPPNVSRSARRSCLHEPPISKLLAYLRPVTSRWWSVVRTQYRELLAELLAVFVQLTIGFCADTQTTLNAAGNPNTTAWAWGFATMIGKFS